MMNLRRIHGGRGALVGLGLIVVLIPRRVESKRKYSGVENRLLQINLRES